MVIHEETRNKEEERKITILVVMTNKKTSIDSSFTSKEEQEEEERSKLRERFRFELANEIVELSADDQLFEYDEKEYKTLDRDKPWKKDAKFFTEVKLSALALIKISTHAKRGGELEVMGLLQGKVTKDGKFIVVDAFPLPVEGTETRVSAQSEANEYMIEYNDCAKRNGREEHVVGWYHSHPGYGCWLSGIDVDTQSQNQMFTDPYLAIVVDPVRSQASGRVEIGAFRTYPEGYAETNSRGGKRIGGGGGSGVGDFVPSAKIEDYGVHKDKYYELPISIFKSTLDGQILKRLWDEYWASSFTSMPLSKSSGAKKFVDASVKDVGQKMQTIITRGFLADEDGTGGISSQQHEFYGVSKKGGGRGEMEDEEGGMRALLLDDDANVAAGGGDGDHDDGGSGKERKERGTTPKTSEAAATTRHLDAKTLKALCGGPESEKLRAAAREAESIAAEHAKQSIARALNERLFCRATAVSSGGDAQMQG